MLLIYFTAFYKMLTAKNPLLLAWMDMKKFIRVWKNMPRNMRFTSRKIMLMQQKTNRIERYINPTGKPRFDKIR